MRTVQKTASLWDPAPSLFDYYFIFESDFTKTAVNSLKQLKAEFNRLLAYIQFLL